MTSKASAGMGPQSELLCDKCGATSAGTARICRLCYASLEGAERVTAGSTASRRRPRWMQRPSSMRGWLRVAAALCLVVVAAWWLRGWLSGPPPPFPQVSADRSVDAVGAAWAMPHGGLRGTRETTVDSSIGAASWRWEASSRPSTTLVTDGDAVYVGLEEGVLVALDAETGGERWRIQVPGLLESAPAVAGDRLYVGYRSGGVAALNALTGESVWESQVGVSISTTPLVVDGVVFVAGNGVLAGFDAEDGTRIWTRGVSDSVIAVIPVADDETLVVATFDRVLIFDRSNGELLSWVNFGSQYAPLRSVAIDDGTILVTADGQLMAIDTSMRRPWWDGVRPVWEFFDVVGAAPAVPWRPDIWSVEIDDGALPAAIGAGLVVVATRAGFVRAYSGASGDVVWERSFDAVGAAPVISASGVLVAGSGGCRLLDLDSGTTNEECVLSDNPLDIVPVESGAFVLTEVGIDALTSDDGQ